MRPAVLPGAAATGLVAAMAIWHQFVAANGRAVFSQDSFVIAVALLAIVAIPVSAGVVACAWLLGGVPRAFGATGLVVALLAVLEMAHNPAAFIVVDYGLLLGLLGLNAWGALKRPADVLRTAAGGAALAGLSLLVAAGLGGGFLQGSPGDRPSRPEGRAHSGRVLLVGIDGLDWDTLQRWLKSVGNDADYSWLAERLHIGPFESTTPTRSPVIWTTVATGRRPADHGVWQFTSRQVIGLRRPVNRVPSIGSAGALRVLERLGAAQEQSVSSLESNSPPFWEIMSELERSVDVVGWWGTWPVLPLRGRMVSDRYFFWRDQARDGRDGPASETVYPAPLAAEAAALTHAPNRVTADELLGFMDVPRAEAEAIAELPYRHHELLSELPLAFAMDETYFNIAEHMLQTGSSDGVFAFYFRGVDLISHSAILYSDLYPDTDVTDDTRRRYGKTVSAYYAYVLGRLRQLIELAGDDTAILVVSDHGFNVGIRAAGHDNAPEGVIMAGVGGADTVSLDPMPGVYDVAPTILWLLGLTPAQDMPGRPLVELFPHLGGAPAEKRASFGARDWSRIEERARVSAESDEEMLELLRSLGYIE